MGLLPGRYFEHLQISNFIFFSYFAFIAQWVGYKHICRLTKQQIIGRIGLRGMDRASVNGSEVAING